MKCLTICQPYAHLIVIGEKRVENRTWPTKYRGPLLIHAGKSRAWLNGDTDDDLFAKSRERIPFGAIVGKSQLVACLHIDRLHEETGQFRWVRDHAHSNGPWCWVLDNVVRWPIPISYVGKQGMFDVPLESLRVEQ